MDFSGPSGSLSAQDNCDSVSTLCSEGKGSKGRGNTSFSETHKRRGLPQLAEYCGMPHALRHEGTSPQRRGGLEAAPRPARTSPSGRGRAAEPQEPRDTAGKQTRQQQQRLACPTDKTGDELKFASLLLLFPLGHSLIMSIQISCKFLGGRTCLKNVLLGTPMTLCK